MPSHWTALRVTVHFLGLAGSITMPEIVVALPSANSWKPSMLEKSLLRTVILDIATALTPVAQSSAMIGLPSLQFAFALSVKVYDFPPAPAVYVAIRGFGSPFCGSAWMRRS